MLKYQMKYTPEQMAAASKRWRWLGYRWPTIADGMLQGKDLDAIARRTGISSKKIRQVLRNLDHEMSTSKHFEGGMTI